MSAGCRNTKDWSPSETPKQPKTPESGAGVSSATFGWLPLWAAALAVSGIVALYLYRGAASLASLTTLYGGGLGERYAFRYVMSAFQYSTWIALASALGGVSLILVFWWLNSLASRETRNRESEIGKAFALPKSAGLPLTALGALLAVLICVNAYIRMTALIPEYLYGLNYVYPIFSGAAVAMFGVVLAWAAIAAARGTSAFSKSPEPLTDFPDREMIAKGYPEPPRPPSMEEIAKGYPKPPPMPSIEKIAERYPEPQRPRGLDETAWRTRADRERGLDKRLAEQLRSDDWILISGYRGSAGAIDRVIAGPFGVCALNLINVAGRVSINGHSWRLQRYNSQGVWVESTKIVDGYGRSPSALANQSANNLETLLASRKLVNRVIRGVVLTHERTAIDSIANRPVEIIESLNDLSVGDMFVHQGALREGASANDVARLIIDDHEEYNRDSAKARR